MALFGTKKAKVAQTLDQRVGSLEETQEQLIKQGNDILTALQILTGANPSQSSEPEKSEETPEGKEPGKENTPEAKPAEKPAETPAPAAPATPAPAPAEAPAEQSAEITKLQQENESLKKQLALQSQTNAASEISKLGIKPISRTNDPADKSDDPRAHTIAAWSKPILRRS